MKPTLSQVCSLPSSLPTDFEEYSAGQCRSIELWFTKLETYLQSHSVDDFRRLRERYEVATPVASYQGGLLTSQGEQRREAWRLFTNRLELCQQLEIDTLVVACDLANPLTQVDLERARTSLVQIAQEAGRYGRRAALEFQASAALGNNLQTAAALTSEVGSPHLGLCVDAFHYYCGPSKGEDLGYLTRDNLFHVQVCDLADVPRELAADGDRILPGDGDIPLAPLLAHLRHIGYDGCVSVELMNPLLWQVAPRQFGEIAMTSLRKLLGEASM
ncbi:MAG: sugar phosphate isomerase/epimerase family protein [Pirellulales bacterium]